jgi:hypothetical protein
MAEVRRFPYKGRRLATFEATDGTTIVTYEADQTQIDRIGREYGQYFIYGNAVYIAQYDKGSKNLKTVPNGPAGDQNILNGISNVNLVAEMNSDPNFYKQATGTQSPNTTSVDPNQTESTGGSTPQENQKPKSQRLTYPSNISGTQDRIKFTAVEYLPTGTFERFGLGTNDQQGLTRKNRTTVRDGTSVFLAIQSSITDNNSVDWQGAGLNEIERRLANRSISYMEMPGKQVVEQVQKDVGSVITEVAGYAKEIKVALAGEALGIQNILGRFGQVLNPNLELLFTGPQLRPFNFTFKLSPRSEDEAKEVKDIINYFKKNMAPVREDPNIFLKAPKTFFIEYQFGAGNPHPGLNKIKECALTNCSVDYTPLGTYMTYPDGTMVSYTLSLQFQELEPIYSNDYAAELNGNIEY